MNTCVNTDSGDIWDETDNNETSLQVVAIHWICGFDMNLNEREQKSHIYFDNNLQRNKF